MEGKKRLPVADFLRGAGLQAHEEAGPRRLSGRGPLLPAKIAFDLLLELRRKPDPAQ